MQLTIKSLSKTYANGVRALSDISLDIPNGLFGLLGPNGAGKSSLMRTITTLQEADSGSIFLDGLDVLRQKTELRQMLGYLPQEFGVYPKISAERLLDHIAQLKGVVNHGERKALVSYLLESVNLMQDRKKHLGTFSGGMKQRFGIAQAMIGNPKLLIVDEPTAGLDPAERNRFYNLLSQLGEQTIVILSTHIVEDVSTLCANFAIISKGKVLYAGKPDEAVREMEGKIFARDISREELPGYLDKMTVISTQLKSGRLQIRVKADRAPGEDFVNAAPNLEDVYFSHIVKENAMIAG